MQAAGMNKLRAPDCPHCAGAGRIRVARDMENIAALSRVENLPPAGVGFMWIDCNACKGGGHR